MINNPTRPLVTGEVTINEAIIYSVVIFGIMECLSFFYLSFNFQVLLNIGILAVILYTPIFKKIPIIKNIFCACIVAFSPFFSALTLCENTENLFVNKNFITLLILTFTILTSSFNTEIILDIKDHEGDEENNIQTIPVLLGDDNAWIIATIPMVLNFIINIVIITYFFDYKYAFIYLCIMISLLFHLYNIKKEKFSIDSIQQYRNNLTYTLVAGLIYFCVLIYYN
jgi:geranylgeranylglycerol-phosphate geranylgeranyltransferase